MFKTKHPQTRLLGNCHLFSVIIYLTIQVITWDDKIWQNKNFRKQTNIVHANFLSRLGRKN